MLAAAVLIDKFKLAHLIYPAVLVVVVLPLAVQGQQTLAAVAEGLTTTQLADRVVLVSSSSGMLAQPKKEQVEL
jgi:hypothetical protein